MKKLHFGLLIIGLIILFINQTFAADRGRVRIVNNVVVADNGAMLRGASAHSNDLTRWGNPTWWIDLRDNYKLNTVRVFLFACEPVNSTNLKNLDVLGTRIDSLVELASKANMYLIINLYHHEGYNKNIATQVWNYIAPRYKDRTHVVYEAFNEPVHWYPELIEKEDCDDQVYMYNLIRSKAPETHIIMWSPAHINMDILDKIKSVDDINYQNASFGYHPYYKSDFDAILAIQKAGYPVINTEFSDSKGEEYIWPTFDFQEDNHISWIYLDLNQEELSSEGIDAGHKWRSGVNTLYQWKCNWPSDPFYTGDY